MNEKTNNINEISDQFGLWQHLQNEETNKSKKTKSNQGRKFITITDEDIKTVKDMHFWGFRRKDIANRIGVDRGFFYNAINNPKHPNHKEMYKIFGAVKRRRTSKRRMDRVYNPTIQKTDDQIPNDSERETLGFLLEYIMSSDNSALNAQDKENAELYKSLRKRLRLEDKDSPLYEQTLALYNEITKELINVTKRIYNERSETQSLEKPQDEKDL